MNNHKEMKFSECLKYIIQFHNVSLSYNKVLDKISRNPNLKLTTIEHTHEALLIKQITEWELFCINIISYSIAQDTSKLAKFLNIQLPRKITTDNAHAIINGLNMFSINSASELKKLTSKIIVSKYNPFEQFLKPILVPIDEAILIRNYIAHKSRASKIRLMAHYSKAYKLKKFVEPGQFLSTRKDTVVGPFVCSQWYAWIFMNMAIFSWRLLDRQTYDEAFMDEKSSDGTILGMVRMNLIFKELSRKYNIDNY